MYKIIIQKNNIKHIELLKFVGIDSCIFHDKSFFSDTFLCTVMLYLSAAIPPVENPMSCVGVIDNHLSNVKGKLEGIKEYMDSLCIQGCTAGHGDGAINEGDAIIRL